MAIQPQQKKSKRFLRRSILIVIALLFFVVGAVIGILTIVGFVHFPGDSILSTIFTSLGLLFTLFQWLFPLSVHEELKPSSIIVEVSPSLSQSKLWQSPSISKTSYRSILGLPPPTDSRTIYPREKDVEEIYTKLIERNNVTAIVLTGIGGVGKSTLAALVYRHAEEIRRSDRRSFFATEALWLRIDPSVNMANLAGTIFDSLGMPVPDLAPLSAQDQALALFNALNTVNKARLVVLDQFEYLLDRQTGQVLPSRPGIAEWLDALNSQNCRCRVLLTSRYMPQGTREYPATFMQEYPVKGIVGTEGVKLLRQQGVTQDLATDAELCEAVERCGGHALALTLLSSLLRNHHLRLTVLLNDQTYAHLWEADIAHNLLDYIYNRQLNSTQRKLVLAFSVYREPVPLDAALAIFDHDPEFSKTEVVASLDVLLVQHLLEATGEGRYQLHPIIEHYAQDHFVESDEQANQQVLKMAHVKAALYYQNRLSTSGSSRELRRKNVPDLVEAVWHLIQGGQEEKAIELIQQKLSIPLEKGNREEECKSFNKFGKAYADLGRMEEALNYYKQALSLSRELKLREEEGKALNDLGLLYFGQDRYDDALASLLLAKNIFVEKQNSQQYEVQRLIDTLHHEVGEEQFAALLTKVEPQAFQIVEQALSKSR